MKGVVLVLMTVMVAVVMGKPNHPNNCQHWCTDAYGAYTCCDKLPVEPTCPHDPRPDGDCNRPLAARPPSGGVSGPQRCSGNHDCTQGALCCYDSCLKYRKCTNV